MDTHDLDYWVQFTRFRSKRRKRRMLIDEEDKVLIQKFMELRAIWDAMRRLDRVKLKPPIQRGYVRFFILRPDVARSKDGAFFQKILQKINSRQYSNRKDFMKKARRHGRKQYVVREQKPVEVCEADFAKRFSDREKLYFEQAWAYGSKRKRYLVYRFIETWRFVLKIEPNMITEVQVKNLDLERRMAEIRAFLNHQRSIRLNKALSKRKWKWDWPDPSNENPLAHRSLQSILDEHWPDKEPQMTLHKNPRETEGFSFYQNYIPLFKAA